MKLFKTQIEFLGLELEDGQIKLQEHIVQKINNFPDKLEDLKTLISIIFKPRTIYFKNRLREWLGRFWRVGDCRREAGRVSVVRVSWKRGAFWDEYEVDNSGDFGLERGNGIRLLK